MEVPLKCIYDKPSTQSFLKKCCIFNEVFTMDTKYLFEVNPDGLFAFFKNKFFMKFYQPRFF